MIEIGIDPNLFSIGSFVLSWHGLMVVLAIIVAVVMTALLALGAGFRPDDFYMAAIWAIIGGIVGARLVHVIDNWHLYYPHNLVGIVRLWDGGLSLYGAIIGGFVLGYLVARIRRLRVGRLTDLAVPGVLMAQAVGRIGCLINGDAYGTPTSLPWGVRYVHPDTEPFVGLLWGQSTHPVPAYEILWDLFIFAMLWWVLRPRLKKDWMLLLCYGSLYSFGRFFLSFLRGGEEAVLFGLHQAQLISILVLVIAIPLLVYIARRPTAEPEAELVAAKGEEEAGAEETP